MSNDSIPPPPPEETVEAQQSPIQPPFQPMFNTFSSWDGSGTHLERHEIHVLVEGRCEQGELLESPLRLDGERLLSRRQEAYKATALSLHLVECSVQVLLRVPQSGISRRVAHRHLAGIQRWAKRGTATPLFPLHSKMAFVVVKSATFEVVKSCDFSFLGALYPSMSGHLGQTYRETYRGETFRETLGCPVPV
jgi:hypothetical protein